MAFIVALFAMATLGPAACGASPTRSAAPSSTAGAAAAGAGELAGVARGGIPVLAWHDLVDEHDPRPGSLTDSFERFEAMLAFLRDHGFRSVFPDAARAPERGGERQVILTFDDGHRSALRAAALMERYGFRGIFFAIPSRTVEGTRMLGPSDVERLAAAGHRVAPHGHAHRSMAADADEVAASLVGARVRPGAPDFAYPFGHYTPAVATALGERYRYLHTVNPGYWDGTSRAVPRMLIGGDIDLEFYQRYLLDAAEYAPSIRVLTPDGAVADTVRFLLPAGRAAAGRTTAGIELLAVSTDAAGRSYASHPIAASAAMRGDTLLLDLRSHMARHYDPDRRAISYALVRRGDGAGAEAGAGAGPGASPAAGAGADAAAERSPSVRYLTAGTLHWVEDPSRGPRVRERAAGMAAGMATGSATQRSGAPAPVALVGGTIVDGRGGAPVVDGVVVVRDGRIACAGGRSDCAVPADARRVDARGRWIIPGLIDAHVHYSQTGWADGRPDALDVRDRFPYAETVAWLRSNAGVLGRSSLCSGVTATYDVGGYPWTWELRAWSDTSTVMPHVEAAGPLLSTLDHWLNLPAERQFVHIHDEASVRQGADYLVARGTSAIKVWFLVGARSDTAALRSMMETTAARARAGGVPLIVHATGLWDATVAVANGASVLVHSVDDRVVDDEFLRLARRAGTIYVPTLTVRDGYVQLAARSFDRARHGDALACVDPVTLGKATRTDTIPGGLSGDRLDAYRSRIAAGAVTMAENLRRVRAVGIPVAMGTDAGNPLTLHGPAVFVEMEAMAAAGMSPMEVLVASTRVAADAMGRGHDLGTLEVGKVADLVVLTADPLADVTNLRRIEAVMRGGRLHDRSELLPGR